MNKYAITVVKIGNHKSRNTVFDISKTEWCKKNNVDYIEITEMKPDFLGFENRCIMSQKYQCIDICEKYGYEKVLHLDWDVIINPNTPLKVFDIIDEGIGVTHDSFGNMVINKPKKYKVFKNLDSKENIYTTIPIIQGGFLLYCKGTSKNFQFKNASEEINNNFKNWGKDVSDQEYITYLLEKYKDIKFRSLTRRYNYLPIYYDSCKHLWKKMQLNRYNKFKNNKPITTRYNSSFFIHYCGIKHDTKLAEEDWRCFKGLSKNTIMFDDMEEFIV